MTRFSSVNFPNILSISLILTNLQGVTLLITTETKSSSLCPAESNVYRTLLRTSEIMEYFKSLLLCCMSTKCRNHVTLDLKSPKIHRQVLLSSID